MTVQLDFKNYYLKCEPNICKPRPQSTWPEFVSKVHQLETTLLPNINSNLNLIIFTPCCPSSYLLHTTICSTTCPQNMFSVKELYSLTILQNLLKRKIETHTYIHTHTYTHIQTYIHTHIHTYTHIYTHTNIHTHIHTYKHTHTHTYVHTHTYTYIQFTLLYFSTTLATQAISPPNTNQNFWF
jgi:hypothetical protein